MTSYPAGTRARVTFVGEFNANGEFVVDGSLYRLICVLLADAERVEVIEPEWRPGDVVLDANGELYRRLPHGPYGSRWGSWDGSHSDDAPPRPLTLLARDGKPVCPQVTA